MLHDRGLNDRSEIRYQAFYVCDNQLIWVARDGKCVHMCVIYCRVGQPIRMNTSALDHLVSAIVCLCQWFICRYKVCDTCTVIVRRCPSYRLSFSQRPVWIIPCPWHLKISRIRMGCCWVTTNISRSMSSLSLLPWRIRKHLNSHGDALQHFLCQYTHIQCVRKMNAHNHKTR